MSAVQHGEDHIHIDGAVGGATERGRVALKGREGSRGGVHGLGRDDDGFAAREHGGAGSGIGIPSAQVF
jgi:hypothetical protein